MSGDQETKISSGSRRPRMASQKLSSKVDAEVFRVVFAGGPSKTWPLPKREDKAGIRAVRDAAMEFAKEQGATVGQQNAVRKALAQAGYYLTR